MNILFVNDIPFNPIGGGIERVTDILSKELIKRGYTIYYLCGKLPQAKQYLLNYEFPAKLFQLPNYGFFDDKENSAYYIQLQTELQLDIVINQRGLGGKFNSLLPITNTKIVSVLHSIPDSYITVFVNKLVELTTPPFVQLKKLLKRTFPIIISIYWKRKATNELISEYNKLVDYSNVVVTLSEKYIDKLKHYINVSHQAKIISIPNPNTFNVTESFLEQKEKIILYVGRLEKDEKEPLRLLKIWKYLHKKHPDWCLKIVGEGEEEKNMNNYINEHRLNNVFLVGRQSDVVQFYKKASFVCLTSNFEGWGMALTEGMQYGCIPLTFNNYGAAFDIIDDGVNGCLISAFDLRRYAYRLSELMSDEAKRIEMSNAAIEKVKMFSVENVVNKWEKLFKSL